MNTQAHRIKKQVVEVRVRKQMNTFQLQSQLSLLSNTRMLKILDELFSEFSGHDEYIFLDTLEVDLGRIPLGNQEEEFLFALKKRIREVLFIKVGSLHSETLSKQKFRPLKEKQIGRLTPLHPLPDKKRLAAGEYKRELFRYFLRTGTLPWWANTHAVDLEQICNEYIETFPEESVVFFGEELVSERVRKRMVYQLSEAILFKIIEVSTPSLAFQIKSLVEDFTRMFDVLTFPVPKSIYRFIIWNEIFVYIFSSTNELNLEREIIQKVIPLIGNEIKSNDERVIISMRESIKSVTEQQYVFKSKLDQMIKMLFSKLPEKETISATEKGSDVIEKQKEHTLREKDVLRDDLTHKERQGMQEIELGVKGQEGSKEIQEQPFAEEVRKEGKDEKELKETISVKEDLALKEVTAENCGLVLLWSYLGRFFSTLGIVHEGRFMDEQYRMRAAYLLHYLVTGKEEAQEFQLPLNKLLCGLDISYPVCYEGKITEKEKRECTDLLNAAIKNWGAIKNTSVEGFRMSFLQRKGMLEEKEKHWLLRVEREAYDMLLEKLPLSISIIKLSWMKTALYVEW